MNDHGPMPAPYSPEWVRLPEPYVHAVAAELASRGVDVVDHWNDPVDPRDVTVIGRAPGGGRVRFVWDEESGWRHGPMDAEGWVPLHRTRYLGAGLLPTPRQVGDLVVRALANGATGSVERPLYRTFRDYGDGLDAHLAAYTHGRATADRCPIQRRSRSMDLADLFGNAHRPTPSAGPTPHSVHF